MAAAGHLRQFTAVYELQSDPEDEGKETAAAQLDLKKMFQNSDVCLKSFSDSTSLDITCYMWEHKCPSQLALTLPYHICPSLHWK